jgi:tripartite-type tricarboxylate transporter receptor subunit TctC
MLTKIYVALAGAFAALGAMAPARAQSPEAFYAGKTVSLIIGYSVGGGYDIYGRALARHIGRHIPGNPGVVTQNMPGAGSQKSLEYLLTVAPKDGLTLGTFSRTLAIAPLIEGAKYDPTRLEWIGSVSTDASTCVAWHASPVKTWEDLKSKPFTVGGLGKASDPDMYATILRVMFGLNVKLVSGYPGTNDVGLAMERGEVDGMCGFSYSSLRASRKNWLDEKKATILVQAALTRDPAMPEVPMLLDKTTSSEQHQALSLILAPQAVARPFAMPPGTPADRLQVVRAAFMATMIDPEFVREAKAAGLDIDPIPGLAIAELYKKVYATTPSVVADARRAAGN